MTPDERHANLNAEIVRSAIEKGVVKEALKEWLDSQFAAFGRWTFYGLISAALAGLVWVALKGFH